MNKCMFCNKVPASVEKEKTCADCLIYIVNRYYGISDSRFFMNYAKLADKAGYSTSYYETFNRLIKKPGILYVLMGLYNGN